MCWKVLPAAEGHGKPIKQVKGSNCSSIHNVLPGDGYQTATVDKIQLGETAAVAQLVGQIMDIGYFPSSGTQTC